MATRTLPQRANDNITAGLTSAEIPKTDVGSRMLAQEINAMHPGMFFYIVAAVVLALALQNAFFVSWQSTGWTAVQYNWANAGVLLGVCLIWYLFWMFVWVR